MTVAGLSTGVTVIPTSGLKDLLEERTKYQQLGHINYAKTIEQERQIWKCRNTIELLRMYITKKDDDTKELESQHRVEIWNLREEKRKIESRLTTWETQKQAQEEKHLCRNKALEDEVQTLKNLLAQKESSAEPPKDASVDHGTQTEGAINQIDLAQLQQKDTSVEVQGKHVPVDKDETENASVGTNDDKATLDKSAAVQDSLDEAESAQVAPTPVEGLEEGVNILQLTERQLLQVIEFAEGLKAENSQLRELVKKLQQDDNELLATKVNVMVHADCLERSNIELEDENEAMRDQLRDAGRITPAREEAMDCTVTGYLEKVKPHHSITSTDGNSAAKMPELGRGASKGKSASQRSIPVGDHGESEDDSTVFDLDFTAADLNESTRSELVSPTESEAGRSSRSSAPSTSESGPSTEATIANNSDTQISENHTEDISVVIKERDAALIEVQLLKTAVRSAAKRIQALEASAARRGRLEVNRG